MKNLFQFYKYLLALTFVIFCAFSSTAQIYHWARQAGGLNGDAALGTTTDATGNVYICGFFTGSSTFSTILIHGASGEDAFVAKYNSSGEVQWVRHGGGAGEDNATALATDALGNVYVAGFFTDSATFGSSTLKADGVTAMFVAKYTSSGNLEWVRQSNGIGATSAFGVDVLPDGSVAVTGRFRQQINFGSTGFTSSGSSDVFLTRWSSNGDLVWAAQAGGPGEMMATGLATDTDGNIFITGFFYGNVLFDDKQLSASLVSADVFIAKYNIDGQPLWAVKCGGNLDDTAFAIATDLSGNAFVTGYFLESATYGTTYFTGRGYNDIFLVKVDTDGEFIWAKQGGGPSLDFGTAVTTDAAGNIYVTGVFDGSAIFGTQQITGLGNDIFITAYAPSGQLLWVQQAGDLSSDISKGITADNFGNLYVAGYYFFFNTFGDIKMNISKDSDVFLVKMSDLEVGVWDVEQKASVSVFPNPSAGDFMLKFPSSTSTQNLYVFDNIGRKVYAEEIAAGIMNHRLDLNYLPAGFYLIQVVNNQKTYSIRFEVVK